ncbi:MULTISPECIES: [FeFe] hydrogenase H-cluster radical SAM maturase HydG [unclassified Marinitoga]|uniref:[FeFe] hydrogenase H-cluster radical SAM maturase HydG n=1 Tax=unclassified Marinitoga TaxID=2640159 RepID=UPI000640E044|nr:MULTISPECIES: [FeFe] hydrogenase H-cluster radical SAM maturase HydG [unclassified Marinitoga]KLO24098.1 thiamine biosynthesis protein ThiH [Marinitoga sp. 1155]NUU99362.1 thiamine biosynthesis protein ThiH [Marinitoga sp. 1154]
MFYIKDKDSLKSFIPQETISELLEKTKNPDPAKVREIIQKSLNKNRLEPEEMATLLNVENKDLLEEVFEGARELKRRIYGNRIVLFAPLYIGNECINNCQYCGFRITNKHIERRSLSLDEVVEEVKALENKGHKRLIVVFGEHPKYDAKFMTETIKTIYETKVGKGEIRRVNVNAAPQTVGDYKLFKEVGIGTFQIFQETYHYETYKKYHLSGPKSNFHWRLYGLDRAFEAGLDDVGIGALFGLYDWKFEAMGLLYHTIHFEERFNVGPHTISFPRMEPALDTPLAERPPYAVSDDDFKKLVAILRLAVPYTGLILTAREPVKIRNEVMKFGVSQIDGGSSIGVGSYHESDDEKLKRSQFLLGDNRTLDQIIEELAEEGYLPSFCTGCYRLGRTGEHFMEFAIPGFVKRFCTPNAILTFLEYIEDYAPEKTKIIGIRRIEEEIKNMKNNPLKEQLLEKIEKVKNGERDLYF